MAFMALVLFVSNTVEAQTHTFGNVIWDCAKIEIHQVTDTGNQNYTIIETLWRRDCVGYVDEYGNTILVKCDKPADMSWYIVSQTTTYDSGPGVLYNYYSNWDSGFPTTPVGYSCP